MRRLNGWERIGVVAVFIWISGASVGLWNNRHLYEEPDPIGHIPLQAPPLPPGYTLDTPKPGTNPYDAFSSRVPQAGTGQFDDLIPKQKRPLDTKALFEAFVDWAILPPFITWLVISICIVTIRWIRRGFAKT
jgi:hypothetical protein